MQRHEKAELDRMQAVSATLQRCQELLQRWMLAAQPQEFSVKVQRVNIDENRHGVLLCLSMSQFYQVSPKVGSLVVVWSPVNICQY